MGLKKGSSASPSSPKAPGSVEFQESLPVQLLSYKPLISVKPDFAKKKFKTGTSKRYRSSLMGSSSIPTSALVTAPEEEDLDVDKIINTVAEEILEEIADQVLSPDVGPEAMTSGISENPNLTNPNVDPVEEPIEVQPIAEEDDHEDQDT